MTPPLHRDLALLVIDAQAEFLDTMHAAREPVEVRIERLLHLADWLELPTVITLERPVDEKGELAERLVAALPPGTVTLEKSTFDCMGEASIRDALRRTRRGNVAVAGSETDVCVLQSVLSLVRAGYRVQLVEDALFSSAAHTGHANHRMRAAGAVPTTVKSLSYELTRTVDRTTWPQRWRDRLAERPHLFPPPENLPPLGGAAMVIGDSAVGESADGEATDEQSAVGE